MKHKAKRRRIVKDAVSKKDLPMDEKKLITVITINSDSDKSPDSDEIRSPIMFLKDRSLIDEYDKKEDCFMLGFDPYDLLSITKCCFPEDCGNVDPDLQVLSQKGKVACRDYPHPRHACGAFPFASTPHKTHCEMCYCYICDTSAPCLDWEKASHCDAFDNEAWNRMKKRDPTKGSTINNSILL